MVVISLSHTYRRTSSVFMFWRADSSGYAYAIEDAGEYTREKALELVKNAPSDMFAIERSELFWLTETLGKKNYLPNTPRVRKEMGINILMLADDSTHGLNCRDDFSSILSIAEKGNHEERFKNGWCDTYYTYGKDCLDEPWFFEFEVNATSRKEAEAKLWKEHGPFYNWGDLVKSDMCEYFCFRKAIGIKRKKRKVFDGWKRIR